MIFRLDCHVKVLHCAVKLLGFEATSEDCTVFLVIYKL